MKKQLLIVEQYEDKIEFVVTGELVNDLFVLEVSDIGFTVTGKSVSKTSLTEIGQICLSPIGEGKIELYIG